VMSARPRYFRGFVAAKDDQTGNRFSDQPVVIWSMPPPLLARSYAGYQD
jgi:hypothetical protein